MYYSFMKYIWIYRQVLIESKDAACHINQGQREQSQYTNADNKRGITKVHKGSA